jgi:hypothetical protein
LIAGFDNDRAGRDGIKHLEKLRRQRLMSQIQVCYCDPSCKDWNDMHVKDMDLKDYIKKNSTPYDEVEFMIKKYLNS